VENLHLVTGHAKLHCLDIHIVDVKNAFLQAEMKEEEMMPTSLNLKAMSIQTILTTTKFSW